MNLKPWERPPLITVKGTDREIKRGEAILKAAEPAHDEIEQLPGIIGINKGFQINLPVLEKEQPIGYCGKSKSRTKKESVMEIKKDNQH